MNNSKEARNTFHVLLKLFDMGVNCGLFNALSMQGKLNFVVYENKFQKFRSK